MSILVLENSSEKMKVFIFTCLFLAVAFAQDHQCPGDKEYTECGSACPDKCNQQEGQMCTMQCVPGCFCKSGYVLDDKGICIDRNSCPNQCPKPHQKWNTCGTACEPSCKEPKPQICTKQCVIGCQCEKGYVKDDQGNCILQKDCPNRCPKPHQKWNDCGTACEPNCKAPNPQVCTKQCVIGCQCESGYVKDDQGNCILEKDCPNNSSNSTDKSCPKRERWSDECVATSRNCRLPNCPNNSKMFKCSTECTQGGCVCKDGFYRDDKRNCVLLNRCNNRRELSIKCKQCLAELERKLIG